MTNSLNLSGNFVYNSIADEAAYYQQNENYVKGQSSEFDIEENNKGFNYLRIKKSSSNPEERVHVFISRNLFTYIKYWFLKHLSNNWTEVKLYQPCETGQKKIITLLIDNKQLTTNGDSNKTIRSIFEFALRPKMTGLDQVPARSWEPSDWLITKGKKCAEAQAIADKEWCIQVEWNSYPLIKELFLKQFKLDCENRSLREELLKQFKLNPGNPFELVKIPFVESEQARKLKEFGVWFKENSPISFTSDNPLTDAFNQEMVDKLSAVISQVDKLPAEFQEIGLKIKKEWVSDISNKFFSLFRETTREWTREKQAKAFATFMKSSMFATVTAFAHNQKGLNFIKEQLWVSWRTTYNFFCIP